MKRKVLIIVLLFLFIASTASAERRNKRNKPPIESNHYLSLNAGISIPRTSDLLDAGSTIEGEWEMDGSLLLTSAIGYDFGPFRAEFELGYKDWETRSMDLTVFPTSLIETDGNLKILTFMINGYHDFKIKNSNFTPYVGLGFGIGHLSLKSEFRPGTSISGNTGIEESKDFFAYQVKVGTSYRIQEQLSFNLNYQYFAGLDPTIAGTTISIKSHEFLAGFRIGF